MHQNGSEPTDKGDFETRPRPVPPPGAIASLARRGFRVLRVLHDDRSAASLARLGFRTLRLLVNGRVCSYRCYSAIKSTLGRLAPLGRRPYPAPSPLGAEKPLGPPDAYGGGRGPGRGESAAGIGGTGRG